MRPLVAEAGISLEVIAGPVWVTIAYLLLYYAFIGNVARVKVLLIAEAKRNGTKFDRYFGRYPRLLAADRIQLNTLEQMPVFLAALWLHAFVVGPDSATFAGALYVVLRGLYPLLLGLRLGRNMPLRLLLATFPAYGVIGYLLVRAGFAVA